MHAEIFGNKGVGSSKVPHHPHEGEVGDRLHGGKHEGG